MGRRPHVEENDILGGGSEVSRLWCKRRFLLGTAADASGCLALVRPRIPESATAPKPLAHRFNISRRFCGGSICRLQGYIRGLN